MEKKVRGIISLFSLGYRAGSTNLQSWYRKDKKGGAYELPWNP